MPYDVGNIFSTNVYIGKYFGEKCVYQNLTNNHCNLGILLIDALLHVIIKGITDPKGTY